jgi:small multidrug resistance family-3 protein
MKACLVIPQIFIDLMLFHLESSLNFNVKNLSISLFYFFLAGLCEIGGGYLVWLWLREEMSWILGIVGGFILFLYGIIPTFQQSHFHRIYAAYGGIFIVMALLWGWIFEKIIPDTFDILGAGISLVGVVVIFYLPRNSGGEKSIWSRQQ